MAKLPSRRELANKLDALERDLALFAAGGGAGAVLARSPIARRAATAAVSPLILPALGADVLIRREKSIPVRAGVYSIEELVALAEGAEMQAREMGVTPTGPVIAPTAPTTKKKVSKYAKAVKAGMKVVKESTSYGKKGVISNARKAFGIVNKELGKRSRGWKIPKKGLARKIATTPAAKAYTDEILRRKMK